MSTWILLVIVYSHTAPQPIGITSVPGYTSQIDCQTAQNEVGEGHGLHESKVIAA